MRPGYGMFQQQSAKMRLTPQLRKAITILQLSTPELLEIVQQEMNENPVLEYAAANERIIDGDAPTRPNRKRDGDAPHDALHYVASNELTLERHLKEQLFFMSKAPQTVRRIVIFMIGNLDSNGYLGPSIGEISDVMKVERELVEQALTILQSFEPAGVGARNLQECLLLQVQSLAESFPLVATLIRHHLKDVADFHIHKLSQRLQASPQEIHAAVDVIKGLNPRPGAAFHTEAIHYIIPEVVIEKSGEGLVVFTHQAALPRLSMNGYYERLVKEGKDTNEAARFLTGKLQSAMFFLRCLEQRRKTIFRVAQAIAEEQNEFFWKGTAYLKPMTLKHIADKLGMHESTVSRATAGKYAQTPWGIFELKHFFPSGLPQDCGDAASSERVKARLKEWILSENPAKPYSDLKLAALLNQEGIQISRRTVTKYREELGISSSLRRKRI